MVNNIVVKSSNHRSQIPNSPLGCFLLASSTQSKLSTDIAKTDTGTVKHAGQPDGNRRGLLRQSALNVVGKSPVAQSESAGG